MGQVFCLGGSASMGARERHTKKIIENSMKYGLRGLEMRGIFCLAKLSKSAARCNLLILDAARDPQRNDMMKETRRSKIATCRVRDEGIFLMSTAFKASSPLQPCEGWDLS